MNNKQLKDLGIRELRILLDSKEISAPELAKYYIDRILANPGNKAAFSNIFEDITLKQATNAQKLINNRSVRMWTGIPVSVSDNICIKEIKSPYDATIIKKLKGYGAVITGKTVISELDADKGKNISGIGITIGSCLSVMSIASDTGGSALNQVLQNKSVVLKPTYGVVSRYGYISLAPSMDQISSVARTADECGLVLDAMSDYDPNDPTMKQPNCYNYCQKIGMGLNGLILGLPKELMADANTDTNKSLEAAVRFFKSAGCNVKEVSLPSYKYSEAAFDIISAVEAAGSFSYLENKEDFFGKLVKNKILFGKYIMSADNYKVYKKALSLRYKIKEEYSNIFSKCDFLLSPVLPAPVCISGLPSIALNKHGMNAGIMLTGRAFDEITIIGAADAYEKSLSNMEEPLC